MNGHAITFDFHNTLASCPEWFELEVRTLPSAFLQWWAPRGDVALAPHVLDDANDRYRQLRRDIIEHGNELSAEACLADVFNGMNLAITENDVAKGVAELMRAALDGASPVPGAIDTIREIHSSGIPLGVVSSAVYHPFLEWTLNAFGLQEQLNVVVTSASAGFYKSRPEIFLHAAQALGSNPARMVHVGDSLRFDVGGAGRAGMGTVWLRRDGAHPEADSPEPDLIIDTLECAAPEIMSVLHSRGASIGDARV